MKYLGENLTGNIEVDGNEYVKCVFTNCQLVYRGGLIPTIRDCSFKEISVRFEDEAKSTLEFMMMLQAGGFHSIIEPTLENIRKARMAP